MSHVLLSVTRRDLLLARRRQVEALLPLGFFVVAAGLFPIGVGPEAHLLRQMAPGVVWVCALLAAMLSVTQMFASDHQDGSLEQMLLSPQPLVGIVLGKVFAHWLGGGAGVSDRDSGFRDAAPPVAGISPGALAGKPR